MGAKVVLSEYPLLFDTPKDGSAASPHHATVNHVRESIKHSRLISGHHRHV